MNSSLKIITITSVFVLMNSVSYGKNYNSQDFEETANKRQHQRPSFSALDINTDGIVELAEFELHQIPHGDHETVFNMIDTDGDSTITETEFNDHKPPRHKHSKGGESHD